MTRRILVAEDDPSILKMTKLRLEHAGYEVLTATDGEDALKRLEAGGPVDLILLDLRMPKLDGFQVCQRLKTNPSTAAIPVIIFSGADSYLTRLTNLCVELGASDWIEKPFRSQDLLEKIQRALLSRASGTGLQGASSPPPEIAAAGDAARAAEVLSVLVVDDDYSIRALFKQILSNPGFAVIEAESGEAALAVIKNRHFVVAFIDVVLPGMDGLETLKALRKRHPHLPVVMMTGYAMENLVALSRYYGAMEFLNKPFEDNVILKAIERLRNSPPP